MKKTTLSLIASLIACSTLFSSVSWADGPGDQRWQQHGGDQHQDHGRGPDHGGDRGPDHGNNRGPDRGPDHHDRYADHRGPDGHHDGDHFAWNGHDFRRGHPMPPEYRGPHYRVDDWRERRLPEPPRGEYWSYVDGNYVLIAAATGVITSLLLNGAFN
ncbi:MULTISPECIES: RcnB family protein [unclassified Pantoea]|uniref:RcnB family protein n=1 Tax=unclassified Pantoea TaxID=2630326 RepID=UPI001CD1B88E|nr:MULTISPECIES: RcnB family protein [unclassified Pantoea]MCA1175749.1 RcnB family protein [Pantoea sp. alder69]MCA1253247.1 RcnB family protein [Pantoea sp. alder70]MCA1263334.1 RcnB family protein [Pantoea sp. alder81]